MHIELKSSELFSVKEYILLKRRLKVVVDTNISIIFAG